MGTVIAFGLKAVRKSGKDDNFISLRRSRYCLTGKLILIHICCVGKTFNVSDLGHILYGIQGT